MFRTIRTVTLAAALAARADAQPAARPRASRADTVPMLNAFLRARGDTLWFTLTSPGRPPAPTIVVLVSDAGVFALAGARRVPAPPELARAFRSLYAEARACPRPAVGCVMDQALMDALGRP